MSGLFPIFFRFVCSGSIVTWQHVLTEFPYAGASATWLHQTLIEALSPGERRVQGAMSAFSAT